MHVIDILGQRVKFRPEVITTTTT